MIYDPGDLAILHSFEQLSAYNGFMCRVIERHDDVGFSHYYVHVLLCNANIYVTERNLRPTKSLNDVVRWQDCVWQPQGVA